MVDVRRKFLSETSWHGPDGNITHAYCFSYIIKLGPADFFVFVVRVGTEKLIDAQGYNVISALKAVG